MEMLQNLYKFLQDNGVDPNNLESINEFLAKLEEINPDFVTLFEFLLNGLAGDNGGEVINSNEVDNNNIPNIAQAETDNVPSSIGDASTGNTDFLNRFDNLKRRNII
jgi:FixJ family two-component response regulator